MTDRMTDEKLAAYADTVERATRAAGYATDEARLVYGEALLARGAEDEKTQELSAARAEVERLERALDEFAIVLGYGEWPEGRSGVVRPSLPEIAKLLLDERVRFDDDVERLTRERDEAKADERTAWNGYEGAMAELRRILVPAPDEKLDDAASRVVAERDAARKEADRLRDGLKRLREKVKRGLALCDYLNALNDLEPDDE